MKRIIVYALIAAFASVGLEAQDYGGFAYGAKGGLSVGTQKWNNTERDLLFAYHGVAFIESLPAESRFSIFAQAGYHVKGSAIRSPAFTGRDPLTGMDRNYRQLTQKSKFNNLSLGLGAKQRFEIKESTFAYYMLGIRGEYTLSTNLCSYEEIEDNGFQNGCPYSAYDNFTRKWNYGMILGGGIEFEFAERIGALVELSLNPDVSQQYRQPAGIVRPNTSIGGNNFALSEQLVKNTTIELSIGLRLLRLVEYID